ncbi:hypothetical protein A1O1_03118 [Capronia coronata CBS 617.96]|uniref:Zn(2)-C6 fungal-type domain-containing protein n=1 Tax=Capronia coronata CBS 617.96 TaxID=1182541 RepID=W9YZJ3_9EURO|nr:uncharacterized protein A1O1_03118 [Capronia coronata CBS 617.96]EXJ94721.1 hypothetical protein A1O1_03118 [Capronia coronata CBS 617.96]
MDQRNVVIKRVRRRQHSSCDQCRKGKRACDAAFMREQTHLDTVAGTASIARYDPHQGKPRAPAAKCSNCQKAGRNCTFDWLECALPRATKGIKKKLQSRNDGDTAKERSETQFSTQQSTYPSTLESDPDLFSDVGTQNLNVAHVNDPELFDIWGSPEILFDQGVSEGQFLDSFATDTQAVGWETSFTPTNNPPFQLDSRSWPGNEPVLRLVENVQDPEEMVLENQQYKGADQELYSTDPWSPDTLLLTTPRYSSAPTVLDDDLPPSLLSETTLSSETNRWLLAQNWLRVYHDSMENALSCWLTERNCPYTLTHSGTNGLANVSGPQWSNRIYQRVCNLDKAINNLPGRRLSSKENSMAERALNAAVMAFGVQWAQAGDRGGIRHHTSSFAATSSVHEEMNLPTANEFGRSVQETLWNQARQALQDAAGVESYRVAFANIIFSLTQRPLNPQDWTLTRSWKPRAESIQLAPTSPSDCGVSAAHSEGLDSRWDALQEILSADGPPVFLEAASRQLISSRWKLEQYNRKNARKTVRSPDGSQWEGTRACAASIVLSREHRDTFRLLSWLAIMFDTLTAAILRRPPVVPDEDTSIESSDPWESTLESSGGLSNSSARGIDLDGWDAGLRPRKPKPKQQLQTPDIWDDLFLQDQDFDDHEVKQHSYSLDDAAAVLCDAAPVKVLLFRKVGHIQKLMARRAGSEALEQAVDKALSVYMFWNSSFGKFITHCMRGHHNLPARIQSWYLILAGHWHLGAMLLADVIEEMDQAGLSHPARKRSRQMSDLSNDMRRKDAIAISELCRCSLYGSALSFPAAREFTYPVNQVALLSEPWTLVLIQSFSRAGYVFVSQLHAPRRRRNAEWSTVEDERILARMRCEYCIEGLLHLSNKSDMAYLAGKFLRDCLSDLAE